jgi:hypothetical protein
MNHHLASPGRLVAWTLLSMGCCKVLGVGQRLVF